MPKPSKLVELCVRPSFRLVESRLMKDPLCGRRQEEDNEVEGLCDSLYHNDTHIIAIINNNIFIIVIIILVVIVIFRVVVITIFLLNIILLVVVVVVIIVEKYSTKMSRTTVVP